MKRTYNQQEDIEGVIFFFGEEVEYTPAFGMETLFVVGVQPVEEIAEQLSKVTRKGIQHIFFGANHSFNPRVNDYNEWKSWEEMITFFLEKGYLCSLDIPMSAVEEFHDGGLCEYSNFIPQIRISIPYIKLWNYNTMVKIDDKGFNATNPGVWTHSLHSLMDRSKFTDWNKYNNDKVIK